MLYADDMTTLFSSSSSCGQLREYVAIFLNNHEDIDMDLLLAECAK